MIGTLTVRDLRCKHIAKILRCSRPTARAMLDAGMIPGAYKIGRRGDWRMPAEKMRDYVLAEGIPEERLNDEIASLE